MGHEATRDQPRPRSRALRHGDLRVGRRPATLIACAERTIAFGAGRSGTVDVPGAKNSVLKLMAATLLADGTYDLTQRARHRRRDDHGRPARGDRRATCVRTAPGRLDADQRRRHHARSPRTSWSSASAPRSTCSARCSAAAARSRCRCRAATTSAPARSTCTSRGLEAMGADVRVQPRLRRGPRRPAARRRHHARVPERRRDREHRSPRRCYAKGTTVIDNAAREPEIADLVRDARRRWAPTSRASARRRSSSTASSRARCAPCDHARRARPHPGGDVPRRGRRLRRRGRAPRRPPRAHGDAAAPLRRHGPRRSPIRATACGVGAAERAALDRRRRRCRTRASPPTTSR